MNAAGESVNIVSKNRRTSSLSPANMPAEPVQPDIVRLAHLLSACTPHDGVFELSVPGAHAGRHSHPHQACVHSLRLPCLSIIAQGSKTVIVGNKVYTCDPTQMLVYSVAIPVAAQITQASYSCPYLAFRLDLDPQRIAELVLKVFPNGLPPAQQRQAVYSAPQDASIIDAVIRLLECLGQPTEAELIGPLVVEEILIRLLRSPIGVRVAQMGFAESTVQRIANAIAWLRENFSQPIKIEELAGMVHMSVSSFHEHFKSVTSMTPLHYQKALRLQAARQLMLSALMDAASAGQRVGYLSPSQFSREYSRFFGTAPARDIARLRHEPQASA